MQENRLTSLFFGRKLFTSGFFFLLGILLYHLLPLFLFTAAITVLCAGLLTFAVLVKGGESRTLLLFAAAGLCFSLFSASFAERREYYLAESKNELELQGVVVRCETEGVVFRGTKPFSATFFVTGESLPERGAKGTLRLNQIKAPSDSQKSDGVHRRATAVSFEEEGSDFVLSFFERTRTKISGFLGKERAGAFLQSILLGDRSLLSDGEKEAFRKTASSHLLAVSGLHLSQIMGFLFCILQFFRMGRRGRSLFLLPVLFILFFVMGGAVSVFRAAVMTAFPLVGTCLKRRSDPLTSLTFAACLLVFSEPCVLFDPSFLLSFSATFAIVTVASPVSFFVSSMLSGRKNHGLKKLFATLLTSFAISYLVFLFQIPLMLLLFGEIQVFSSLYALLTIPVFSPCLAMGFLFVLSMPIPALSRILSPAVLWLSELFLEFNSALANAAPNLVSLGELSVPFALGVFSVIFLAFVFKARFRFFFFFGATVHVLLLFFGYAANLS